MKHQDPPQSQRSIIRVLLRPKFDPNPTPFLPCFHARAAHDGRPNDLGDS